MIRAFPVCGNPSGGLIDGSATYTASGSESDFVDTPSFVQVFARQ